MGQILSKFLWYPVDPRITGQLITNGIYTITNKYHQRFVYLEDPHGSTPLKGHFRPGNRNAQWRVTSRGNEQYSIENVEHNLYAYSGSRPLVKAHVEGTSEERLWRIQGLITGEYTIAATDTRNLWMLPSDDAETPVELSNVYTDRRCWWTFSSVETAAPVDENPTTQPLRSDQKLLLASSGGQRIPEAAIVEFTSVITEAPDLLQPLAATCEALRVVIQRAESIGHVTEDRKALNKRLKFHLATVENDIAKLEEDLRIDETILAPTQDVRQSLETYARELKEIYELLSDNEPWIIADKTLKINEAFQRYMAALHPSAVNTVAQMQQQLAQFGQEFKQGYKSDHSGITRDIQGNSKEDLDRTLKSMKDYEESRLLDRLKPIDAPSYEEDHSCAKGTRTTLLDDIVTWALGSSENFNSLNKSNGDNIFWLYGIPGVGKTHVANSLCRRLHETGNLGGTFFCRRDDPNRSEVRRVIPTLIYRLAKMWSPYGTLVAQSLREDPQLNPDTTGCQLFLKHLESLKEHPPRPLILVVDALDECGEPHTRRALLNSLMGLCSRIQWLKVVVTSRHERDITLLFDKVGVTGRDLAVEKQVDDDILLFVKDRMASVAEVRNLQLDWPGEERLNQVVARSGGLFIFATTVCLLVEKGDPEEELNMVLSGESEEANDDLHKLYSAILRSRIKRNKERFQSFARAFIVAASYRPLCDATLASLVGLAPQTVRCWVDDLSSLLYRDETKSDGIRVRHLSVIDFFTGETCPGEFRVNRRQGNAELGLSCLITMMKGLRFNICGLESSYLSNKDIHDLEDRVRKKIPDALQYSCMHWSNHLCSDLDTASVKICEALKKFFVGEWPLYWLEVLGLMGKVPVAILTLRQIKACLKACKFGDQHRDLIEDVIRFVLAFSTPISTSTPHLYVSALPFSPMESIVRKYARKSFPMLLDVCKGHLDSWPARPGEWRGHNGLVYSVAYSPNGQHVVSGSSDNTIRIWDVETGAAVGEPLRGHTNLVNSVAYSPDGQHVVSGSSDNTIRIWDVETGAAVGEPLRGHTNLVNSVAYSPDGQHVVSGSDDNTIRIWDVETGAAVGEPLRGHTNLVNSVAYSPDGQHVVSGSDDNTIRIWDVETGAAVGEPLRGHTGWVRSVAYSPDGQHVVSGSYDNTIRIWDVETGAAVGEPLRGHTQAVNSVAYSPDGQHVVSGSDDSTIRIWDVETGAAVGEPLRGHTNLVNSVAYSPDGQHVVSGSDDNTIRIWDVETGAAVGEPLRGHTNLVNSVAYSPDGQHVVSGSDDNTIRIWDVETGAAVGEPLRGHTNLVNSVAYSPDGQHVVSGSDDNTIRIWDVETGAAVGEPLRGHTQAVNSVAYSPDGQHVVSGSDDSTIRIWDVETGAAVGEPLRGHTGWVRSVAYSLDGQHVVSGSYDNTIRIWDVETGAAVGEPLRGHTQAVNSVAYSPDGQHVVSGSDDNTIRIWDVETGAAVGEPLRGHTDWVRSVAYSPDGQHVVSGSDDNTIRIWDVETGAAVGEPLRGHTDRVRSVTYSPDGQHVVSGSSDNTIRICDAETRIENAELLLRHTSAANMISIFPDYPSAVPGSSDLPPFPDETGPIAATQPSITDFSGLAIPAEFLDDNGWVHDANGLLFWVPDDCRNGLTCHATMIIPDSGRHRSVRLDFTRFRYGASWTEVYRKSA